MRDLEAPPRAPSSARRARASSVRARRSSWPASIVRPGANRASTTRRCASRARRPAGARRPARPSSHCLQLAALQLARALGARQLGPGPERRGPDLLVIAELRVRAAHHLVEIESRVAEDSTACTRSAVDPGSDAPTTAESRHAGQLVEDRSTSSGKTFSPSGVTIISFLRPRIRSCPCRVELADVAGVEPAVLERRARLLGRVVIAGRDVLAAHEDLAVVGDAHLDAGDRLADRAARRDGADGSA